MAKRTQNRPETGPGPFEADVFNANCSKSFPETIVNVREHPECCGTREISGTAIESPNKQGDDVTVWWNRTHGVWQYSQLWQQS